MKVQNESKSRGHSFYTDPTAYVINQRVHKTHFTWWTKSRKKTRQRVRINVIFTHLLSINILCMHCYRQINLYTLPKHSVITPYCKVIKLHLASCSQNKKKLMIETDVEWASCHDGACLCYVRSVDCCPFRIFWINFVAWSVNYCQWQVDLFNKGWIIILQMTQRILFSVKDGTKRDEQTEEDGGNLASVEQKDAFKEDPLSEIEGTWLYLWGIIK